MPKPRPTWTQKLNSTRPHEVTTIDRPMPGWPAGTTMLIATPLIIDGYLRTIPRGRSVLPATMRADLAQSFGADMTCALTSGIFLRIASEAAWEALVAGSPVSEVAPFWRMVDRKSPLARKLTCGPDEVARLREAEGLSP